MGGTSFSGLPPPMIWLTETRRTAIPPPKPPAFMAAEPGTDVSTGVWFCYDFIGVFKKSINDFLNNFNSLFNRIT